MIATFNVKVFPKNAIDPYGIVAISPEALLVELLAAWPEEVISTLEDQIQAFGRPPETLNEFLAKLTPTVPMFANLAADAASDPGHPTSDMPALEQADEIQAVQRLVILKIGRTRHK